MTCSGAGSLPDMPVLTPEKPVAVLEKLDLVALMKLCGDEGCIYVEGACAQHPPPACWQTHATSACGLQSPDVASSGLQAWR